MKKIYTLLLICLGVTLTGQAQQQPHFGQYMLNSYIFNPSLTGIENYTDVRMSYRNQWTTMEGAPVSLYLSANGPINKTDRSSSILSFPAQGKSEIINKLRYKRENDFKNLAPHHGIGATVMADKIGMEKRIGMNVAYAYHLPINRKYKLSSGVSAGFTRFSMDVNDLDFGPNDDPVVAQYQQAMLLPELSLGTTLYGKYFYVGASVTQLLQNSYDSYGLYKDGQKRFVNHYNLTAGFEHRLSPAFAITPSVLVKKAVGGPILVDANLKASYLRQAWAGVSYRHQNSFAALVGYNFHTFMTVGYAYEVASTTLNQYNTGTHEIMLGFIFNNTYRTHSPIVE